MKQTISFNQFCDAFRDMGRDDNFSYEGKRALYDWLNDMYNGIGGDDYDLDVIALCCEFSEYESIHEFWDNYCKEEFPTHEAIADHTSLIMVDDTAFIISDF